VVLIWANSLLGAAWKQANHDPTTRDFSKEQNLGTVTAWKTKEGEENITMQRSHTTHVYRCEDPDSGSEWCRMPKLAQYTKSSCSQGQALLICT